MSRLRGRRIAVCRASHQAAPLIDAIEAEGGQAIHVPLIDVALPLDEGVALRRLLSEADASTWVAVTSANGVDAVVHAFASLSPGGAESVSSSGPAAGSDRRVLAPAWSTAVVGRATAARAAEWTLPIAFESPDPSAAGLGRTLPAGPGDRVIAAVAELAGPDLRDALTERGVPVEVVTAYRTLTPEVSEGVVETLAAADAVLVTAPSVIRRLIELIEPDDLPTLVAIGPTTVQAVIAAGLPAPVSADRPSVDGLIDAAVRSLRP